MLLVGNQGVGKNKLVDRLLHLLAAEREYMQLHRDSTVQSLTLVPSLEDGAIVYRDSVVVQAAKNGRVLVVDEADKAPLEVVCILKALAEDEELGHEGLAPARRGAVDQVRTPPRGGPARAQAPHLPRVQARDAPRLKPLEECARDVEGRELAAGGAPVVARRPAQQKVEGVLR